MAVAYLKSILSNMNYIINILRFKIILQISQYNTALAVNDHSTTKSRMPRRPRQAYSHSSLPRMTANRRRPERPIAEEFDTKSLGRGTSSGDPCKVS